MKENFFMKNGGIDNSSTDNTDEIIELNKFVNPFPITYCVKNIKKDEIYRDYSIFVEVVRLKTIDRNYNPNVPVGISFSIIFPINLDVVRTKSIITDMRFPVENIYKNYTPILITITNSDVDLFERIRKENKLRKEMYSLNNDDTEIPDSINLVPARLSARLIFDENSNIVQGPSAVSDEFYLRSISCDSFNLNFFNKGKILYLLAVNLYKNQAST